MSHPFDLSCTHTPACPSWWCCERRGSYEDAKARYAEHHRPIVIGHSYEWRILGETKEGRPVYEQVEVGSL